MITVITTMAVLNVGRHMIYNLITNEHRVRKRAITLHIKLKTKYI